MPYDRDSFLAGVAVGRNMRSMPIREHAESGAFQFTIEIDRAVRGVDTYGLAVTCPDGGTINWGDGQETTLAPLHATPVHQYASDGVYQITIIGGISLLRFGIAELGDETSEYYAWARSLISVDSGLPPVPSSEARPHRIALERMFFYCENLVSLPPKMFAAYKDDQVYTESLQEMFSNCHSLLSIPYDFFDGLHFRDYTARSHNGSMFEFCYKCEGLISLPGEIFSNPEFSYFTDMRYLFYRSGLVSIPAGLFDAMTGAEQLHDAFAYCPLNSIPEGIFRGLSHLTNAYSCFYSCSLLKSIPPDIFSGCTSLTNIYGCFQGCTNLTSVSASAFSGCETVTNISSLFGQCSSLASIPSGIFDSFVSVESFLSVFNECAGLTSVPDDIFDACVSATRFPSTFFRCRALTEIKERWFQNLAGITDFRQCFYYCDGVTEPVPELWNMFPDADGHGCFGQMFDVPNWFDIPSAWR